jgi:hypothetical protein
MKTTIDRHPDGHGYRLLRPSSDGRPCTVGSAPTRDLARLARRLLLQAEREHGAGTIAAADEARAALREQQGLLRASMLAHNPSEPAEDTDWGAMIW